MDERPRHDVPGEGGPAAPAGGFVPYAPAAASAYAPPEYSAPLTLREMVRILRRRWKLVFFTFVATVAAALAVTSQMRPVYMASARVLLDDGPVASLPSGIGALLGGALGGGGGASAGLETEMEKIKSRAFLSEVLRKLRDAGQTKKEQPQQIDSAVELAAAGGGKILQIAAKAESAAEAEAIANTLANVYIAYALQESDRKAELTKGRLNRSAEKALREKERAERDYYAFLQRVGVSDPGSLYTRRAQKTLDLQNTLEDERKDLPLLEKKVALLEQQLVKISPTVISGFNVQKNPKIEDYRLQVTELEKERRVLLRDFGEESEEVQDLTNKIAALNEQVALLKANPYYRSGGVGVSRNGDWARTYTELLTTRLKVNETRAAIEKNAQQLAVLEAEQKRLAPESARFEELRARVLLTREAYKKASNGLIEIDINQPGSLPNIRVLDPARAADAPVSPKPLLNTLMAVFLGAFLGVSLAVLAEYLSATGPAARREGDGGLGDGLLLPEAPRFPALPAGAEVGFSAALPRVGGVPLLAQVPVGADALPAVRAADGLPPAPAYQTAAVEDAFREVGYVLAHHDGRSSISGIGREAAAAGRVPVILFSGTRSDEASASVVAQLCATLVRDGLRVTLVDADRAQPRLNRVFGAPDAPGLADVLAGRVGAAEILHVGAGGSLRFLSAGSPDDRAPELNENGLRAVFDDLSAPADTDLVVVNGPSVWAARQVGPLEKAADGLVLVAPDAVPPAESVARARRLLSNGYQPRILGVVVGRSVPPAEGGAPAAALAAAPDENTKEPHA